MYPETWRGNTNVNLSLSIMAKLNNPLQGVINLLVLVSGFIQKGISGIRKKFSQKDFLPITYVALKDLKVDPKYQRLINLTFISKAKVFDPKLVKPLSVYRRPNGDLFIVDGQHTACLAGVYVEDPDNFELPCQIQDHPNNFTLEECEEKEAEYFTRFNYLRNNVGTIEKLRAEIARGVKSALTTLGQLEALKVHVQGIGDESGPEVQGYKMLKTSLGKYGVSYTKRAVDLCKYHLDKGNWTKPLDGSIILGLSAAYHFVDNYLGEAQKNKNFIDYLSGNLTKKTVKDLKYKTAGQLQDVLILEKIIEHYNDGVGYGANPGPTVGMDGKNSLFSQWKEDEIHNKPQSDEND